MFDFTYTRLPGGNALSCTWIETNDPRQPLLCLWLDDKMRVVEDGTPVLEESVEEGDPEPAAH
jgi:hypothetical protein